jgi:hypothetical protein
VGKSGLDKVGMPPDYSLGQKNPLFIGIKLVGFPQVIIGLVKKNHQPPVENPLELVGFPQAQLVGYPRVFCGVFSRSVYNRKFQARNTIIQFVQTAL